MTQVKQVPTGYHTATPYLILDDAAAAIEFYQRAFGAKPQRCMEDHFGRVTHAEIRIGNSPIMLCDEDPAAGARSPQRLGGSPVSLLLYVEDADAFVDAAVSAGARLVRPVEDQFYGDRCGTVGDPFGYEWHIATRVEDVSDQEIGRRAAALFGR